MIPHPDVSIIIPLSDGAANGAPDAAPRPDLSRAIASIGDDPRAEILVVNDAADPVAGLTLIACAAIDARVRPVQSPRPGGGAAEACNAAIELARAPLIAFLDPADIWLPGKLGAQRALHAGHPEIGFSFTDARRAGAEPAEAGSVLRQRPRFQARHADQASAFLLGPDALAQILAENMVVASTVVARAGLLRQLGGFAAGLGAAAAAWDLWLRLAGCASVACRPEITVETPTLPGADLPELAAELVARHRAAQRTRRDPWLPTGTPRAAAPRLSRLVRGWQAGMAPAAIMPRPAAWPPRYAPEG